MPKPKEVSFENAMERLEKAVEQMESRDLPLDQIIEKYEEGMKLIDICEKKLQAAEKKIELLTRSRSGEIKISNLEIYSSQPQENEEE